MITDTTDSPTSFEIQDAFETIEKALKEKVSILQHTDLSELKEKQTKIRTLHQSIENFYELNMAHLTTQLQQEKEILENEVQEQSQSFEDLQDYQQKLNLFMSILKNSGVSKITKRGRGKAKKIKHGEIASQESYFIFILETLIEMGGEGRSMSITESVGEKMSSILTEKDKTFLSSSRETRWESRTHWAKTGLIKLGYMRPDSPTGLWQISEAGRQYYQELKEGEGIHGE